MKQPHCYDTVRFQQLIDNRVGHFGALERLMLAIVVSLPGIDLFNDQLQAAAEEPGGPHFGLVFVQSMARLHLHERLPDLIQVVHFAVAGHHALGDSLITIRFLIRRQPPPPYEVVLSSQDRFNQVLGQWLWLVPAPASAGWDICTCVAFAFPWPACTGYHFHAGFMVTAI